MPQAQGVDVDPGYRFVRDPMGSALSAQPLSRTASNTTDVYLVEDFPILRDGLRTILEGAGHRVIGEADHPAPAVADLARLEPPVAVVDLRLDHHSGIEVLEQVQRRQLRTRVILLSLTEHPRDVAEAMRMGAFGYLLKDSHADELLNAVDKVASGGRHLGQRAQQLAVEGLMRESRQPGGEPLSMREKQIVMQVLRGKSSAAIAASLFLSRLAIREGWIDLDDA